MSLIKQHDKRAAKEAFAYNLAIRELMQSDSYGFEKFEESDDLGNVFFCCKIPVDFLANYLETTRARLTKILDLLTKGCETYYIYNLNFFTIKMLKKDYLVNRLESFSANQYNHISSHENICENSENMLKSYPQAENTHSLYTNNSNNSNSTSTISSNGFEEKSEEVVLKNGRVDPKSRPHSADLAAEATWYAFNDPQFSFLSDEEKKMIALDLLFWMQTKAKGESPQQKIAGLRNMLFRHNWNRVGRSVPKIKINAPKRINLCLNDVETIDQGVWDTDSQIAAFRSVVEGAKKIGPNASRLASTAEKRISILLDRKNNQEKRA